MKFDFQMLISADRSRNASATALKWFASDTANFCVSLYNICGEAIAHLYGEEQSF